MNKVLTWLVAGLLLFSTISPAQAMTAEEARQACEDLKTAVEQARKDMIQVAIPKQDPAKTFNDATQSCLQNIANVQDIFQFRNITLAAAQAILKQMATELLTAACQAATEEFNNQVNDALAEVNSASGDYISVGRDGATVVPPTYNVPTLKAQPTKKDEGFFSGLMNWISGDDDKGGNGK